MPSRAQVCEVGCGLLTPLGFLRTGSAHLTSFMELLLQAGHRHAPTSGRSKSPVPATRPRKDAFPSPALERGQRKMQRRVPNTLQTCPPIGPRRPLCKCREGFSPAYWPIRGNYANKKSSSGTPTFCDRLETARGERREGGSGAAGGEAARRKGQTGGSRGRVSGCTPYPSARAWAGRPIASPLGIGARGKKYMCLELKALLRDLPRAHFMVCFRCFFLWEQVSKCF